MELWTADSRRGLMQGGVQVWNAPCFAVCGRAGRVFAAAKNQGFGISAGGESFTFALPDSVGRLSLWGDYLYALSADADCICLLSPGRGELMVTAPAGHYPRNMCISPCGRRAAVAGGAAGEVLLFDRELHCLCRHRVAGVAVDVCFLPRALAVLCAVGDENVFSHLVWISARGVTEEIYTCPQAPGCLCALPGGKMMMGCAGAVLQFNAEGRLVGRQACQWPGRILLTEKGVMLADCGLGGIRDLQGRWLYTGGEPADFCVV